MGNVRQVFTSGGVDLYKSPILLGGKKIIFMPIGRVASRSIRRSLYQKYEFTLLNKEDLVSKRSDHKIIAVTRNPLERLVSAYRLAIKDNGFYFQFPFATFKEFVQIVVDLPDEISDLHFASQVSLLSHEGLFLPTHTLDISNINNLTTRLEIPEVLYHQKTRTEGIDFRDMYTARLVASVKERYADDFSRFGY